VLQVLRDRLAYPHKKSALKYLIRNPSLALSVLSASPSKVCILRTLQKTLKADISLAKLDDLSRRVQGWACQNGLKDPTGERTLLYLIVRCCKPDIVVETGVAHGSSSAFMLHAMEENSRGELYSIDIPPYEVPAEIERTDKGPIHTMPDGQKHRIGEHYEVGDLIPENLKHRWSLTLGDAAIELPPLLERLGRVSIFLHDSLHTYEHMTFEYETAWRYITSGGLLLSHDVLWNEAFMDFSGNAGAKYSIYRNLGVIRKS
jgi:hypothetical protein